MFIITAYYNSDEVESETNICTADLNHAIEFAVSDLKISGADYFIINDSDDEFVLDSRAKSDVKSV